MHVGELYKPRNTRDTALYRVLSQHLETFLARTTADPDRATLPRFVTRSLRGFLDCGDFARGLARVHCSACSKDQLVPYACKKRGFCPSCGARRMAELAAHLVDHVLPEVPLRQWVLSFPFQLRYLLAYNPDLLRDVRGLFIRAVMSWIQRRAAAHGHEDGKTGAVIVAQNFDSALRVSPHFHAIVLDGVFTNRGFGKTPVFHPIPPPTDDDIAKLARNLRNRIVGLLLRRGHLTEDGHVEHQLEERDDPMAAYYAAAVQGRNAEGPDAGAYARRLRGDALHTRPHHKPLCASFDGFSLHANITAEDRRAVERLCRYVARPPIVMERLSITPQGRVRYGFRRPWRDGTFAIELDPLAFIERLAALVPRPRKHLVTYHGILAPAASDRARVVPQPLEEITPADSATQDATPPTLPHRRRPESFSWPQLMARVFRVDVLLCPCGGRRKVLDFITEPRIIRRILTHLGLPAEPRRHAPARPLPQGTFAFT